MTTLSSLRRLTSLLILCGVLSPFSPLSTANAVNQIDVSDNKPAILLAENYRSTINPADYLVSEKLDGVRAIWDGKQLRFRSGQVISAPTWFTENFPSQPLDGELWIGRGKFDQVSAATRRIEPVDSEWREITYQVFELPDASGTFADRVDRLKTLIANIPVAWIKVVEQFRVLNKQALQLKLNEVTQAGGEGLMLHRADAIWQTGRSDVLLKLKKQWDAEAKVVGYLPGKGKYRGMTGALLVEMPDGKRFQLGTGLSDELRKTPPKIGSIITYRYRHLTPQGVPRFANFLRMYDGEV